MLSALLLVPTLVGASASPPVVSGPYPAISRDVDLARQPVLRPWRPGDPVILRGESLEEEAEEAAREARRAGQRPTAAHESAAPAGPAMASAVTLGAPLVSTAGLDFTGISPPDPVLAVGQDHVIQMVNDPAGAAVAIYDKAGARIAGPFAFQELWPNGAACREEGRGDPIVVYDALADRWLLSQLGANGSCFTGRGGCHLCLAMSKTPDPVAGGWWLYDVTVDPFPDYPKYAVWPDAYYLGVNQVERINNQIVQGAGAWALDRSRMLAGEPVSLQRFQQPPLSGFAFQGLLPATVTREAPPAGTPGLFLRHRDAALHGPATGTTGDALELWRLHVSWTDPTTSTLEGPIAVPVAAFSSHVEPAEQGSGAPLQAREEPLMWPVGYRREGTEERLTGSFTVAGVGGQPAVRWFELGVNGGAWSVAQEGTYAPDGAARWMSSAATDHEGNLAVLYTVASGGLGIKPSIRYAGRRPADPTGTLPQPEQTLVSSNAWQENGPWGDYGALAVDPKDGCTFWGTHEHVKPNGSWTTRVGAFRFSDCDDLAPPPPPPTCVASDTSICLADGRFAVSASWTVPNGNHGVAHARTLTPDTGYLYFFQATNVEALVKVLAGCGVNQHHWVFAAGLTNVLVDLRVEDTLTGAVQTYQNPQGQAFLPIQDTAAFACP